MVKREGHPGGVPVPANVPLVSGYSPTKEAIPRSGGLGGSPHPIKKRAGSFDRLSECYPPFQGFSCLTPFRVRWICRVYLCLPFRVDFARQDKILITIRLATQGERFFSGASQDKCALDPGGAREGEWGGTRLFALGVHPLRLDRKSVQVGVQRAERRNRQLRRSILA